MEALPVEQAIIDEPAQEPIQAAYNSQVPIDQEGLGNNMLEKMNSHQELLSDDADVISPKKQRANRVTR